MAERVQPALRGLWNLGAAPRQALDSLERLSAFSEGLAPDLDDPEQEVLATVAPLLSPPQVAGAIERALERQEAPAPVAEPVGAAESSSMEARAAPRPRRRSRQVAPRFDRVAATNDSASTPATPTTDAKDAPVASGTLASPRASAPRRRQSLLDTFSVPPAHEASGEALPEGATSASPAKAGARVNRFPPRLEAAALERMAALTSAGEAPAPGRTRRAAGARSETTDLRPFASAGSTAPGTAAPPPGRDTTATATVAPTAPREATRSRSSRASISAAAALERLARRADRAGASTALQTPVSTDAAGEDRAALLSGAQATRPDDTATGPSGLAQALERAVARVSAPVSVRAPGPGSARTSRFPSSEGEPPPPSKEPSRLGGLAGLAARAEAASSVRVPSPAADAQPAPALLSSAALPAAPVPAVLAERMEEAQLTRRLERILRREATRAGVDLEGLDP